MTKRIALTFFILLLFVAIRIAPAYFGDAAAETMANISPFAALALCGGMLFPPAFGFSLTFGAFAASDFLLNLKYGQPLLNGYSLFLLFIFGLIFYAGYLLRERIKISVVLGASVGASIAFYFILNSAAFVYDPAYTKTFGGWIQANTSGVPGYPPAWLFGIRSMISNIIFALAFYFVVRPTSAPRTSTAAVSSA